MSRAATQSRCSSATERDLRRRGYHVVAGADEAGRGSLFGPVFAAAVALDPNYPVRSLNDSKQLEPERREVLAERIRQRAVAWRVAAVDSSTIDRINIYQASRLAMKIAIEGLSPAADYVLCDALTLEIAAPQRGIIQGDARCHAIAAASILAKVERDRCMKAWEDIYPGYGLAQHKGYPTPEHRQALARLGPTPLHRLSYAPVRAFSRFPVDWNQPTLFEPDECL